ncbi:MAG: hypothetical protein AAGK98_07120, partial [Pseudomonadota bacterium]
MYEAPLLLAQISPPEASAVPAGAAVNGLDAAVQNKDCLARQIQPEGGAMTFPAWQDVAAD